MTRLSIGIAASMLLAAHLHADTYSVPSGLAPNQLFVSPGGAPEGGVDIFTSESDFQAAAAALGKQVKFVETFEEATTAPGGVGSAFPAPLEPGVPAGDFPNGLEATNIRINCEDLSGDGLCDLITLGQGFLGLPSIALGANDFGDGAVIETLPGVGKTAIGFDVADPGAGVPDYDLVVADTSGGVLFSGTLIGVGPTGFIGVVTDGAAIGSITVNGTGGGGELIDNVQLFVPEPTSGALLVLMMLNGLALIRRR